MKTVFPLAVLLGAALVVAAADRPYGSKELKIPPSVLKETRDQILGYFGTNHVTGVPLLDQTVDWNWFTNWPDQFKFAGHTYTLRMSDVSGSDYVVRLESRVAVRPGMRFLAQYGGPNSGLPLGIAGGWSADGSVNLQSVDCPKTVFSYQFHPNGRLYCFARDVAATNYIIDWFDARGELAGTWREGPPDTNEPYTYRWRGREVEHEQFSEEQRKCYQEFSR